jgi:hypothetical protein
VIPVSAARNAVEMITIDFGGHLGVHSPLMTTRLRSATEM